ncbi:CDKC1 [Auxenochlorella protothecoides x Auxenochlorella symbiontica]
MVSQNGSQSRKGKAPSIPAEWKVELPEEGNRGDSIFGGCRSIEAGYQREFVLGQGTYGEVYRAVDRATGDIVAAKKIKMDNEKEGFPITAIREIKILSALAQSKAEINGKILRNHVITLREIVRSGSHKCNNFRGSIYMIFDYMDHDMTGLLARSQREGPPFSVPQIKCYMQQLLLGLALLETNKVLHRDLKNSNLLINDGGILRIGDFGLARYRPQGDEDGQGNGARMTNRVITLWYRPPELLLGAQSYGPEIDMWSAGCIMFEMLTSKPLFSANDELGMCDKIFSIVGKANEKTMPGCTAFSNYQHIDFNNAKYPNNSRLRHHLQNSSIMDAQAKDLMEQMLLLDPKKRISAKEAASHPWFYTHPLPMEPHKIPKYQSSHEMSMKRSRQEGGGAGRGRHPSHPGPPSGKQARLSGPGQAPHPGQRAGPQGRGPGGAGPASAGTWQAYPPQQQVPLGGQHPGQPPLRPLVHAASGAPIPYPAAAFVQQGALPGQQPGRGQHPARAPLSVGGVPPPPPAAPLRGPPPGAAPPPPAAWQSQRR